MTEHKKVSIPGPIYVIIGAVVVLMSVFVGIQSTGLEKMSLFIFVGAIFIVVGFVKVISKEKKHTHHHVNGKTAHHAPAHQTSHHSAAHAQHAAHHKTHKAHYHHSPSAHAAHQAAVMKCPGCGTKVHPSFKYCHNCGHMLKH